MTTGIPQQWAENWVESRENGFGTWDNFEKEFKDMFINLNAKSDTQEALAHLKQGNQTTEAYFQRFEMLA